MLTFLVEIGCLNNLKFNLFVVNMYDFLVPLATKVLNLLGSVIFCVFLFQWGITRLWPRYPLGGVKNSLYLCVILLGVYGFIRRLITGL